jgi:thymidylate kinase
MRTADGRPRSEAPGTEERAASGRATVHPDLAAAFEALDRADVRWCVLRGEGALARPGDDVDLLIRNTDFARATAALRRVGFVRLAGWGRGSHRFFVSYDGEHDAWIKLDVVSALSFGRRAQIATGAAGACLVRRVVERGVPLLAEQDRVWALLLHFILDRGDVPERHAASLRQLAQSVTPDGPLCTWFARNAPNGWSPERVLAATRAADWPGLVALGRRMQAEHSRRTGTPLAVARAVARRLAKLRTFLIEPGATIALLGPDGAGKSTLAAELARTFYFPVRSIYMGLYGSATAVGRPPRGAAEHVRRLAGHIARQWRGYLQAVFHRYQGRLVIYDRFGYDALLREPRSSWIGARVRRWLLSHAVPAPDLVVILDAPPEVLRDRKREHELAGLQSQRNAYLALASRVPGARVVRTDRDADAVRREVIALIWRRYVARSQRRGTRRA